MEKNFTGFYQENKALLSEYIDVRISLFKLQGIRAISRTMSLLIVVILVGILGMFTMLFLGFAFAWWLSDKTGSTVIGFAGAGALFALIMVVSILFRKSLFQSPLTRIIIRESMHEPEDSI